MQAHQSLDAQPEPRRLRTRQIYKLMTGIIVPRPVALVSTVDRNGVANLAPFSFFSGVGSNPPTVLFCPAVRAGDRADPDISEKTRCATSKRRASSL